MLERRYCTNCFTMFTIYASSPRGLENCTECGSPLERVPKYFIPKTNQSLKFTPEERKEIFDDWRKHIKSLPTQEINSTRERVAKFRNKQSRTLVTANI